MKLFRGKKSKDDAAVRRPQLMEGQDGVMFRRSRTLTGSSSLRVAVAAETSAHLQSPRLKAHQLRRHQRGIAVTLVLLLCATWSVAWLIGQFIIMPSQIRVSQAVAASPPSAEYLQSIGEYMSTRPTEQFLFNLDQEQLTQFVHERHPEVGEVVVDRAGLMAFDVAVSLREPVATWKTQGREVFVDREGEVFFTNYFDSPGVAVDDQSGIDPSDIGTVASDRFIGFMGRLVDAINAQSIGSVQTVIIPQGTARQIDIRLHDKPYIIKTHIDRLPIAQAKDVAAAVRFVEQNKLSPEYLDVRIAGRAYYR